MIFINSNSVTYLVRKTPEGECLLNTNILDLFGGYKTTRAEYPEAGPFYDFFTFESPCILMQGLFFLLAQRVFILLDFCKNFRYNRLAISHDSKGSAWFGAACHNTTWSPRTGSIIFIVQGIISKLKKKPNAYSGCSKQPGYAYEMVKRRRELLKEGYRFDSKTREWVKR